MSKVSSSHVTIIGGTTIITTWLVWIYQRVVRIVTRELLAVKLNWLRRVQWFNQLKCETIMGPAPALVSSELSQPGSHSVNLQLIYTACKHILSSYTVVWFCQTSTQATNAGLAIFFILLYFFFKNILTHDHYQTYTWTYALSEAWM